MPSPKLSPDRKTVFYPNGRAVGSVIKKPDGKFGDLELYTMRDDAIALSQSDDSTAIHNLFDQRYEHVPLKYGSDKLDIICYGSDGKNDPKSSPENSLGLEAFAQTNDGKFKASVIWKREKPSEFIVTICKSELKKGDLRLVFPLQINDRSEASIADDSRVQIHKLESEDEDNDDPQYSRISDFNLEPYLSQPGFSDIVGLAKKLKRYGLANE